MKTFLARLLALVLSVSPAAADGLIAGPSGVLGVATATSLAIGGAALGGNALAVTGTITSSSTIQATAGNVTGQGFVINRSGTALGTILDDGDGIFRFFNGALNGFTGIKLGGTTALFPYIVRNATGIEIKLADSSAFTTIKGKLTTDTNYTAGVVTPTGYLTIYDGAGVAYKISACTGC